jgi:glycosyltransferase involved in cell wall biosynthesis
MSAIPPVSVCLVTYNRAQRLPKTIDSLLAQSFADFEFIISDDCSTDETQEICQEYVRRDPRIRYRRNERNLGMPGNLNVSLQAASGSYLANLHDGDVYRSDLIARWRAALDAELTAGFVFNAYRAVHDDGRVELYRESYPPLIPGRQLVERLLSQWGSCVFGTVMARRSAYEQVGWFDPQFGNFSDVDMWLRIAAQYDVAYVSEPLMDLMPRDPTRFYAFVHWQVAFWILGIHTLNVKRCRTLLPKLAGELQRRYRWRRLKYLTMQMLLCLKHHRWDRVREGLAIWRDADDSILRTLGHLLGNVRDAPEWYTPSWWDRVCFNAN